MTNVIRHPEWRASLEPTKYPFNDTATLTNGDVIIPNITFIDASFYVSGATAGLYLTEVVVSATEVTIYIGTVADKAMASVTFDKTVPPDVLRFTDANGKPAGMVVSDSFKIAIFSAWSTGNHVFTIDQTGFVARCCHAVPSAGLRGFLLDDGSIVNEDVWLVGDDGVVLTCTDGTEPAGCSIAELETKKIRIDVVGDSLFRRKLCSDPEAFETPSFLQSLTFIAPGFTESSSSYFSSSFPSASSSSAEPAPKVDILFFTDTTGSMSTFLSTIKLRISDLVTSIKADMPDVDFLFAVADYKDTFYGVAPYDDTAIGYRLAQAMTDDESLVAAGAASMATLSDGSNPTVPEGQFVGLKNIPTDWTDSLKIAGRSDAYKIIIQIGDAPGHLRTGTGISPPTSDPYPVDLAEVTDALAAEGIKFIMLSLDTTAANQPGMNVYSQANDILATLGGAVTDRTAELFPEITDGDVWVESAANGGMNFYHQLLYLFDDTRFTTKLQPAVNTGIRETINYVPPGTPPDPPPPVLKKKFVVYPGEETTYLKCGPDTLGDVKIFVHTNSSPETILRVRTVDQGLRIEAAGERLENIG